MYNYIAKRILIAIPTLLIISIFVFLLQKLLPGDPVLALAGEERDPAIIEALRAQYHLNDPIIYQYLHWLGSALHGDLGISLRSNTSVTSLIAQKLPVTLQLALMATMFALFVGIPLGIIAAVKKNTWIDYTANVLALTELSIPHFWLGIMLILLVSVHLGWLPAAGYHPFSDSPWRSIESMLMPAFVLSTPLAAMLMRHTRASMLGVLSTDYIRTSRSFGLTNRQVILGHGLRNAMPPIITVIGLLMGELLAGAVMTEQIFIIPGFGKLVVDAVFNRDYAVVQGVVLVSATAFILINLIADLLYTLCNPRLRASL